MAWTEIYGVCIGGGVPPTHDNDNDRLSEHQTPAECLQWVRRTKDEMRKELAADFTLRRDPAWRRIWDNVVAFEKCCLWHHFGVRG